MSKVDFSLLPPQYLLLILNPYRHAELSPSSQDHSLEERVTKAEGNTCLDEVTSQAGTKREMPKSQRNLVAVFAHFFLVSRNSSKTTKHSDDRDKNSEESDDNFLVKNKKTRK